jgi:AcrR family transcriptional regulator
VAERIGYSATTIYLHFENKDDLILATVQDGFEAFDRRMEEIAQGKGNPLQRIERWDVPTSTLVCRIRRCID